MSKSGSESVDTDRATTGEFSRSGDRGFGVSPELAVGYVLAFGRMAVGLTGLLFPRFLMFFWAGTDLRSPNTRSSGLVVGARDFLVGLGTFRALRRNEIDSVWLRCGAFSDTVDSLGTLLFFRQTPWGRRLFIFVTVGGSACAGWWLANRHQD